MNIYGGFAPVSPFYGQFAPVQAHHGGLFYNYGRPCNGYPQQFGFQCYQPQFQAPFAQNVGFNQNMLSPSNQRIQEAPKQTNQNQNIGMATNMNNMQQMDQQFQAPRNLFASGHFKSNIYGSPSTFNTQYNPVQRSPLMLSGFMQPQYGQNVYASPLVHNQQNFVQPTQFQNNFNPAVQTNQVNRAPSQSVQQNNVNLNFENAMARSNQTLQNIQKKISPPKEQPKEVVLYEEAQQFVPQNNNLEDEKIAGANIQQEEEQINNYHSADVVNNANIHILRYEDGFIYEGDAIDSQRNGFGVLKNEQGHIVYLGSWENDAFHGQGELRNVLIEPFTEPFDFQDFGELGEKWEKYEGEFKDNAFHGKGELYLANGEKFVGEFFDGKIEGEGVFYDVYGETVPGVWRENVLAEKK